MGCNNVSRLLIFLKRSAPLPRANSDRYRVQKHSSFEKCLAAEWVVIVTPFPHDLPYDPPVNGWRLCIQKRHLYRLKAKLLNFSAVQTSTLNSHIIYIAEWGLFLERLATSCRVCECKRSYSTFSLLSKKVRASRFKHWPGCTLHERLPKIRICIDCMHSSI